MRVLLSLLFGLLAAAPVASATDCQPDPEPAERALNALRAQAQTCGERLWPAVPALRWHATLGASAQRFAAELAAHDRLTHVSASGATLRMRLHQAGYAMRTSGENLSAGPATLQEVLDQWLDSPAHCENLMLADFQEFGLACVSGPGRLERYWVLQLGAPLAPRPVVPRSLNAGE